jgi:hypothetical protein
MKAMVSTLLTSLVRILRAPMQSTLRFFREFTHSKSSTSIQRYFSFYSGISKPNLLICQQVDKTKLSQNRRYLGS